MIMNTQIIQEIVDFLRQKVGGETPTADVKLHLLSLHPGLEDDAMDYIIAEGDKACYFHRSVMTVAGITSDVIYLPREAERIAPNQNKTKVEDLMEKYKNPVKVPRGK